MPKPDPELGWDIIHRTLPRVPESQRDKFVADARLYEGSFTSGLITEVQYRIYLGQLLTEALKNG